MASDTRAPEPLSATADLLEALRRKRTEREEEMPRSDNQLDPHPDASTLRVIDIEPTPVTPVSPVSTPEPTVLVETVEEVDVEPKATAPKKGRASMPSWDEIVFGTKADD